MKKFNVKIEMDNASFKTCFQLKTIIINVIQEGPFFMHIKG